VTRLPGPGETVLGGHFTEQDGGKGGNQATAAARAGAATAIVAAVGRDELGERALRNLAAEGVDVSACQRLVGETTGVALIVVDQAAENQIAVASGANARLDGAMVRTALQRLDPATGAAVLLGFEVADEAVVAAADEAARRGLRIILNPAPARSIPVPVLALAPILTPNAGEAALLTGEEDPARAAAILATRVRAPVIVSLGASGALLHDGDTSESLPATPIEPVDTTGAGDALNGILAAELARGADLREAVRWAMTGAALQVTQPGARAGLPTREAIAASLAGQSASGSHRQAAGPDARPEARAGDRSERFPT
jgi:ribokinase